MNKVDSLKEEEVREWCKKRHYTIFTSDLYYNCLRSGNAIMVKPDEVLVIDSPSKDYLDDLIRGYKDNAEVNKPMILINTDPDAKLYVVKKEDLKLGQREKGNKTEEEWKDD